MNLLPCPRHLKREAGVFVLPKHRGIALAEGFPNAQVRDALLRLEDSGFRVAGPNPILRIHQTDDVGSDSPEAYTLAVRTNGIEIGCRKVDGLRAGVATLRQLLREFGRRLPCLLIRDWPDFPRRGVMLDISRGRVPRIETLLQFVDHLADFKINELQLYIEHTFAYKKYGAIWRASGALTSKEINRLNQHCRELGIDLVPNQNSFGHLREFLAHPPLKRLAEIPAPYDSAEGDFLRYPSTLAPNHPGTIPFLRSLYDELLPNFSSDRFNVGCDETWDLGRGQSKALCERLGKGRVYLDFLKHIHAEISSRGLHMMFWGDIILKYPELIRELPKGVFALNWGYESDHPFDREAALFARAGIPFYVCPGTSTWMTLIGRHDNALANLRAAARAGLKHGAVGYLNTDWGDGGHPQPLAVSYLPFLAGASLSWCEKTYREELLVPVLSRDIFRDPTRRLATSAMALGKAHQKLRYREPNATPLGATIAAPPPEQRELFCRNGLKYYARIQPAHLRAALKEIELQRSRMVRALPTNAAGKILAKELDLAARMAAQSCHFMLWQQTLAAGDTLRARKLATQGVRALRQLAKEYVRYWPGRNKGSTRKASEFLQWRIFDYQRGILPYPPSVARIR